MYQPIALSVLTILGLWSAPLLSPQESEVSECECEAKDPVVGPYTSEGGADPLSSPPEVTATSKVNADCLHENCPTVVVKHCIVRVIGRVEFRTPISGHGDASVQFDGGTYDADPVTGEVIIDNGPPAGHPFTFELACGSTGERTLGLFVDVGGGPQLQGTHKVKIHCKQCGAKKIEI